MAFMNSFLSMSALDGPGIRCVAFLQGCPLRCVYCHNPDTWSFGRGSQIMAIELLHRVLRYKNYFGAKGGVTLSGGEPFAQAEFAAEFFALCKKNGINTAVDTSGAVLDENVIKALEFTDLCMLDIKLTDEESYKKYTGGSLEQTLSFLQSLDKIKVRTWIRQVIVPGINDTEQHTAALKRLCASYKCIEKIELLPFRKLCISKYQALGIDFPLKDTPEASPELVLRLNKSLTSELSL